MLFFNTETAYWLTDIIIKITCYICLFKLSRKLKCSLFNSCLIACLFACSIDTWTHFGLGIATFPYLIYLLIKNKTLQIKHYLILSFIGLNTDLANEVLIIPMLFFIYLIMCSDLQKYNFKLFLKISSILYFFIFLSNSNLIYAQLFDGPFHREVFFYESIDFNSNLINLFKSFFSIPDFNQAYFFHALPYTFFIFPIILVSLFSRNKTIYLLLIIIFLTLFINFVLDLESIVSLKNNSQGLLKTIHWGYVKRLLPVLYGLLFIIISKSVIIKQTKYLIYPLLFLSLITFQVRISAVPITKQIINFDNLNVEQKKNLRNYFHGGKYISLLKEMLKVNEIKIKKLNKNFKSLYTFEGYYDYENYKFIKSLVNNSKTISIGLDPMVAVVNNIKVIDGYHNLYPLDYKIQFRKVIKEQLDYYPDLKNYYDNWGQRIYTFVTDPKVININFSEANSLGADYVISKYSISNVKLELICEKCNDSPELFLYKIKI